MDIVYLDQNKWIDLARVRAGKSRDSNTTIAYNQALKAVGAGHVLFPLSASHVLETSKRNDPASRAALAETQAQLSRGYAYRSRSGRLHVEVRSALHRIFSTPEPELPENWVIAHGFLQSFEPTDTLIATESETHRVIRLNKLIDPADQYVRYMKNQDDSTRREAHKKLAASAESAVAEIEKRRARLAGETVDMRRRAYSAQLFIDHQDLFIRIANTMGHPFEQIQALGERAVRALIEDVPTLNVEAQMAARLESKTGILTTNDLFDMQSFYTAIPYSTRIIAEKSSVSMAQQAKLDIRYGVVVSNSLESLIDVYPEE
ncbi:hypothetical protein [Novilysobacter antarcticus]|uniref:hypothetical protein n=1 Tax=Novilysobacter antarcticus TaxID=2862543 RepID=UPI001C98F783|nr:hypothetical protein [Lysobacter antarcticus]